eukprot:944861-Prorocentrum_minimum.AAC.4
MPFGAARTQLRSTPTPYLRQPGTELASVPVQPCEAGRGRRGGRSGPKQSQSYSHTVIQLYSRTVVQS